MRVIQYPEPNILHTKDPNLNPKPKHLAPKNPTQATHQALCESPLCEVRFVEMMMLGCRNIGVGIIG